MKILSKKQIQNKSQNNTIEIKMYKKGNTRNSKRLNKKKLQETGHRNNINAVNIALPCDNKVEDSNLQTLEYFPVTAKKNPYIH